MKKQVGYSFIVFGIIKAAFLFYERLTGHSVPIVEDASYILLLLIGGLIIYSDLHKTIASFTNWLYQKVELGIFDALNYALANIIISFSKSFRKTHTGSLNYNIITIQVGGIALLIAFLLLGGYI